MNQVYQNINKDMIETELIDLDSIDLSNDQTWLVRASSDTGHDVDLVDWNLSCEWPHTDGSDYQKLEKQLYSLLDIILKKEAAQDLQRQKFDSRTYIKPKRRALRPSLQTMVEGTHLCSPVPSSNLSANPSANPSANLPANVLGQQSQNKYMTYNKYNSPLGPISPMLRLKTFNVDTNSDNSVVVKDYAAKRKSLIMEDDPQLEDVNMTLASNQSGKQSPEYYTPSKGITIDYSQPAHYLHNTFNKGLASIVNERGSLNMYQSGGDSLLRMSPPSLVSSIMMASSGNYNAESLDNKSFTDHKENGLNNSGRPSLDPMMNSMTLSILNEKDMQTSFLSQTTCPDSDCLIDSQPPSLVNSMNSSYIVPKHRDSTEQNVFSSATFTHLEQSEKLLLGRPRCHPYNFKRESGLKSSESYTKSRDDTAQNDTFKVLNENSDKKDSPKSSNAMSDTVTIHYANNKFRTRDAEKENLNSTFEKDDMFYKEMGVQKVSDLGKNSLNLTLDKPELEAIIQARQKLSMARKTLPIDINATTNLPNQVDVTQVMQSPSQGTAVPKQSMENASELLSRRRMAFEKNDEVRDREVPKRSKTFKKVYPKGGVNETVLCNNNHVININSATLNLIDSPDRAIQPEVWSTQTRAMVASNESTDTATFSSSSPCDTAPDTMLLHDTRPELSMASTPLVAKKKGNKVDLLHMHSTISPIYDATVDKSYTVLNSTKERSYDSHNVTAINSATMVKRSPNVKRDILARKGSPEKKLSPPSTMMNRISPNPPAPPCSMAPPVSVLRKTGLPTSKLRQYSSHKELSRIPPNNFTVAKCALPGRGALRRPVYASNPVLSPTSQHAPPYDVPQPPIRRDSYTVAVDETVVKEVREKSVSRPALIRQGTETLRRDRPLSQLVAPKEVRAPATSHAPVIMRVNTIPAPSRPYSIAGSSALHVSRPTSVPATKPATCASAAPCRPGSGAESRVSALPRPSRLPAPKRGLRPPSVYSVAPTADIDQY